MLLFIFFISLCKLHSPIHSKLRCIRCPVTLALLWIGPGLWYWRCSDVPVIIKVAQILTHAQFPASNTSWIHL